MQTEVKFALKGGYAADMLYWMQTRLERVQNVIDEYNLKGFFTDDTMLAIQSPIKETNAKYSDEAIQEDANPD